MTGILWGILFDSIALMIGMCLYRLHSPWQRMPIAIMIISCFGHFIGTWFMAQMPSDASTYYFPCATPEFKGLGHLFVLNIMWYVRKFLTGDSYLGAMYFFSMFACLGSIIWYLFYLQLLKVIHLEKCCFLFPALVIMCTPSFLFFTSGVKDAISFFAIPVILMVMSSGYLLKGRNFLIYFLALPLLVLLIMVRPYLAVIFAGSYCLSKLNLTRKSVLRQGLMLVVFLIVLLPIVQWVLIMQTDLGHHLNLTSIISYMSHVQNVQNTGSSFPMLSSQPNWLTLLIALPYGFVMNLFMPLFVLAGKSTGIMASFENIFLIGLFYQFWSKRKIYHIIKTNCPAVRFYLYFFILGMLFLAALNTNLGLAMREKSMYLPAFFMVSMLVWTYHRHSGSMVEAGRSAEASLGIPSHLKIALNLNNINTVK